MEEPTGGIGGPQRPRRPLAKVAMLRGRPILATGLRAVLHVMALSAALWAASCGSPTPAPPPTPTPTPAPTPTPTVLEQLSPETGWFLFNVRGLEPGGTVSVREATPQEGRRLLDQWLSSLGLREALAREQSLYTVLGLWPRGADLYQIYLDLQVEQSPAWYSPPHRQIILAGRPGEVGVREALMVAYAYALALQEQHFGLSSLARAAADNPDRRLALAALSGGDATLSMALYGQARFPSVTGADVLSPRQSPALESAPSIASRLFLFPFSGGADFAVAIRTANGWAGLDDAYRDASLTSAEILHPGRYLEGFEPERPPLPDLARALGRGWAEEATGSLGEFLLRAILAASIPEEEAEGAASGWAGDSYALLNGPGGRLLLSATAWESHMEAGEFFQALVAATEAVGEWTSREVAGDRAWWGSPREHRIARLEGARVWLVIGPDQAAASKAETALSGP